MATPAICSFAANVDCDQPSEVQGVCRDRRAGRGDRPLTKYGIIAIVNKAIRSAASFRIWLKSKPTAILPLVLIVIMSWCSFWIDPVNANSQISIAVTSMLTLIAYRYAVDTQVPRLPYMTRVDALF
jgi:hypothetical protein